MVYDVMVQKYGWTGAGVYARIVRFSNKVGYCYASQRRIAKELELSNTCVRKYIMQFVVDGYLVDLDAGKRNTTHRLQPTEKFELLSTIEVVETELEQVLPEITGVNSDNRSVNVVAMNKHKEVNIQLKKEDNRQINKELFNYLSSKNVNKTIQEKIAKTLEWDIERAKHYFEKYDTGTAINKINTNGKKDDREKYLKDRFAELIKC